MSVITKIRPLQTPLSVYQGCLAFKLVWTLSEQQRIPRRSCYFPSSPRLLFCQHHHLDFHRKVSSFPFDFKSRYQLDSLSLLVILIVMAALFHRYLQIGSSSFVRESSAASEVYHPGENWINNCHLFKLSLELRTQIYEELLTQEGDVERPLCQCNIQVWRIRPDVIHGVHHSHAKDFVNTISPAILRTCKLICEEALPILYKRNTFHFTCPRLNHDSPLVWQRGKGKKRAIISPRKFSVLARDSMRNIIVEY